MNKRETNIKKCWVTIKEKGKPWSIVRTIYNLYNESVKDTIKFCIPIEYWKDAYGYKHRS